MVKSDRKVLRFIRDYNLVSPGQTVLVAVSGGPDSVCLFHILVTLQEEMNIRLHVAHLNHQLRGIESDADADYVAGLAEQFGIPVTVESRDVNAYRREHHVSPEEAAREVRYSFLADVAASVGAEQVAVGHTTDDHVETILMHLIRGSGARGLRGLLPVSHWNYPDTSITIIRPLLELSREETTAYCGRYNLQPRTDTSNLSMEPFRNRIRHQLLPLLRSYNPKITEALQRTARLSTDDMEFIDNEAVYVREKIVSVEKGSVIIDKKGFLTLPTALQRQMLRAGIESQLGSLKDIEAVHIEDLVNALNKPAGKTIGLPGGLNFTIEYDRYVLSPDAMSLCPFPALPGEFKLNIPGKTRIPGWDIEAQILDLSEARQSNRIDEFTADFDYAMTGNELIVRPRRSGDRFRPLGINGSKKVNEFMIEARIPRTWRHRVPIVCSPEHILWVVGRRIDERAKVTDNTARILRLVFTRS
jgi:tRNA(Ile)-lysidine synthase